MSQKFPDCLPPASKGAVDSLAAPVSASQGAGIRFGNARQWQDIAYFLAGFRPIDSVRSIAAGETACAAPGKRSAGAAQAGFSAIPDGNHGDNRRSIK